MNFVKFLRTPFFTEHLWWLLLYLDEMLQIVMGLLFKYLFEALIFITLISIYVINQVFKRTYSVF